MERAAKSKEILAKWCFEKNVVPEFVFYDQERFEIKCELTVPGCTYKGKGISDTKSSAQNKATKDFILFLMQQNLIPNKNTEQMKKEREDFGTALSIKTDKVKIVGLNSVTNDISAKELKHCIVSNDRNDNNTYCEVAEESSIIGTPIIEKLEKKKNERSVIPRKKEKVFSIHHVNVDEILMNDVRSVLEDLNIIPAVSKNTGVMNANDKLILYQVPKVRGNFNAFCSSKVIPWCAPRSNWNPWLGLRICQAESLEDISNELEKKFADKQGSVTFQNRIKDRAKLPIFNKRDAILDIIRHNPVVIVQGGTGCGKTTQVCQFILDEYIQTKKGAHCNIICTQPRKIPAINLANRVAYERVETIGESVGYTVRFDFVNPQPFGSILYCTVEILIRKLKKGLFGISHVIVDEVHERHADSEFLLIILKDMVQTYPNLRVILMSANVSLKLFSGYFNNCPVINVERRCYPVKEYFLEDIVQMLNYLPVIKSKKMKKKNEQVNSNLLMSDDYSDKIKQRVSMINEDNNHLQLVQSLLIYIETNFNTNGAVLIFLPGWSWIIELRDYLLKNTFIVEKYSILLLHSALSHAEQQQVFKPVPHGSRKLILSTNIAETSITIEDAVFVIDYGKEKLVESYNNIEKTDIVWISKVNAEQRKGRVGRIQEGFCFYLYTKERYSRLNDDISSKLSHCSLSQIGLTIKYLHLGDIYNVLKKAINPPPIVAVKDAVILLEEIKCLKKNGDITHLGRILAQLPVEPRYGRMMVLGNIFMLGDSLCTIAAGISTEYSLFTEDYNQNFVKHKFSGNRCSDQLAFLNAFMHCNTSDQYCNSVDVDYCNENKLSISSLKTATNIKNQIMKKFIKFGFPECCFEMQDFDFGETGIFDEPQLDMLPALLTMACYPLVYYKENRKVKLKTKEFAIIKKNSVNSPRMGSEDKFEFPFFVFEKQTNIFCVNSTMVSPIHLLLFGARKVEYTEHLIVLDDWIYLKMDVEVAAAIVALRPAIDNLILKISEDPKLILQLNDVNIKLINILKRLCNYNAGRHNLSSTTFDPKKKRSDKAVKIDKSRK